ncbi:MAG: magnesium transporter [Candidatus Aenigmatarchaeota archaeon]
MIVNKHLEHIRRLKRKQYHPIKHTDHKVKKISKRTLFYIKEYGPHSNVPKVIIRESLRILILASIISSVGGLALENIKPLFVAILPLVVLLPALNNMIGNYGTIISSRFSTMLHEGRVHGSWRKNKELRLLFLQMLLVSLITALIVSLAAVLISGISFGFVNTSLITKIVVVTVLDVMLLVSILFFVAVVCGIHFYKKHEDPNNFLIPITTSLADFSNMIILAVLILFFF